MRYFIENKTYQYYVGEFYALESTAHIHTHLEMIYLTKGSAKGSVDGCWYDFHEGDLFLAGANQIHQYSHTGPIAFHLILFTPEMEMQLRDYLNEKVPTTHVIPACRLPVDLREQLAIISRKRRSDELFEKLEAKGRFLSFLGQVMPLYEHSADSGIAHDSVKAILSFCSEHYTEPITLDSIARELHLSKFYISHIFRQRMNVSFTEFISALRVDHACQLLRQGTSITDVAFGSGFSSIRTFNRVFRQLRGQSPRDYQRQTKAVG